MDSSSREYAEAAPPATDGIIGGVADAFNSVRRVFSDLFRLFSLEVRRAGLTLMWMVALGVLAAMLMATAWLSLMAALALWAVSLGLTWISAMVAIALANLATAAIIAFSCVSLSRNLLFPATRRQLATAPARSDVT
jgi:uncharacterized membrane protein YqjE